MAFVSTDIMELLKSATGSQHRDAERRRLQRSMTRARLDAETYSAWLGQMIQIHSVLQAEIERHQTDCPQLAEVVKDGGLHVANLRTDLQTLGADPEGGIPLPSTARALQAIRATSETDAVGLLGYNYVLEGSMNGNRIIARALSRTLGPPALTYLDPYGDEQRSQWLAYRERMSSAGIDAEQSMTLVKAARDMFAFIADMGDELLESQSKKSA